MNIVICGSDNDLIKIYNNKEKRLFAKMYNNSLIIFNESHSDLEDEVSINLDPNLKRSMLTFYCFEQYPLF